MRDAPQTHLLPISSPAPPALVPAASSAATATATTKLALVHTPLPYTTTTNTTSSLSQQEIPRSILAAPPPASAELPVAPSNQIPLPSNAILNATPSASSSPSDSNTATMSNNDSNTTISNNTNYKPKGPLLARSAVRILERDTAAPEMIVDHPNAPPIPPADPAAPDVDALLQSTVLLKRISISPLVAAAPPLNNPADRDPHNPDLAPMDVDHPAPSSSIPSSRTDTAKQQASTMQSTVSGKKLVHSGPPIISNGFANNSDTATIASANQTNADSSSASLATDSSDNLQRPFSNFVEPASLISKLIENGKLCAILPDNLIAILRAASASTANHTPILPHLQQTHSPFTTINSSSNRSSIVPGASTGWQTPILPLLIDLRLVSDFQRSSIAGSICANFPALLVKRFRRRIVSNFNLSNFLAGDASTKTYSDWQQAVISDRTAAFHPVVIVYDDQMSFTSPESDNWAFAIALAECIGSDIIKYGPESADRRRNVTIAFLVGGFHAFQERPDAIEFLRRSGITSTSGYNSNSNSATSSQPQDPSIAHQQISNASSWISGSHTVSDDGGIGNINVASSEGDLTGPAYHSKKLAIKPVSDGGSAGGTVLAATGRSSSKPKLSLKQKAPPQPSEYGNSSQDPAIPNIAHPTLLGVPVKGSKSFPSSTLSGSTHLSIGPASSVSSTSSSTGSDTSVASAPSRPGALTASSLTINKKSKFNLAIDTQSPVRTSSKIKIPLASAHPGNDVPPLPLSASTSYGRSDTASSLNAGGSAKSSPQRQRPPKIALGRTNSSGEQSETDVSNNNNNNNGKPVPRGISNLRIGMAAETASPSVSIKIADSRFNSAHNSDASSTSPDNHSSRYENDDADEPPPTTSPNDNAAPPEPYSRIVPNIYVGSDALPLAKDAEAQMLALGVTHILNMAAEVTNSPDILASNKLVHKWLPVHDNTEQDMDGPLRDAIDFIANAIKSNPNAIVFVHCKAGRSRSVSVVIGYLVSTRQYTLKSAYEHVRTIRKGVSPNLGFMAALLKVEKDAYGENL